MVKFSKIRLIISVAFIAITFLVLVGCSKHVIQERQSPVYQEIHSQIIGFSNRDNDFMPKLPAQNVYLFEDEVKWQEFKNTYIKNASVRKIEFSKEKILYVYVRWPELVSGTRYELISIKESDSKLQVDVRPLEYSIFDVKPSSNSIFFGYLIIAAIDRNTVSSGLIPVLNVIDNNQ